MDTFLKERVVGRGFTGAAFERDWDEVVAVKPDLATEGGLASDPWVEKLAEIRRVAFLASTSSLPGSDSFDPQSLMAGTVIRVSLRVKSGPREFLMGPMGAEMTGRFRLTRVRMFAGVGSRSLDGTLLSRPAREESMFGVVDQIGRSQA